jgi:hypothetical protein
MQTVSVALEGVLAIPAHEISLASASGMLHEHDRQRQPVFRLFDTLDDPNRPAIEMLDGTRISYSDLIARAGQMANAGCARRQAR